MTIEEFAETHKLDWAIQNTYGTSTRYKAKFEGVGVLEPDGAVRSPIGEGRTPNLACLDYAKRIQGCDLKIGYGDKRREFKAPDKWDDLEWPDA